MDQRPLCNTGLRVSAVGFGAWQHGNPLWGGPDEAEALTLVHAAVDMGCTFFDTAPGYGGGASERLLGKALQGRRDEVVLCTKYGHADPRQSDFSVAGVRAALEASLGRLRTDHVDVLLLHNPPLDLLDGSRAAGLYAELEALRREGKHPRVRRILEVFVRERDGFALAEADLRQRGPGEFFGARQAGLDGFQVGDLTLYLRVLDEARGAAAAALEERPDLDGPWEPARAAMESRWAARLGLGRIG